MSKIPAGIATLLELADAIRAASALVDRVASLRETATSLETSVAAAGAEYKAMCEKLAFARAESAVQDRATRSAIAAADSAAKGKARAAQDLVTAQTEAQKAVDAAKGEAEVTKKAVDRLAAQRTDLALEVSALEATKTGLQSVIQALKAKVALLV